MQSKLIFETLHFLQERQAAQSASEQLHAAWRVMSHVTVDLGQGSITYDGSFVVFAPQSSAFSGLHLAGSLVCFARPDHRTLL